MNEPIFTNEWATHNYALWLKHLGHFTGKPTNALEIGSYEGRSSCFFVKNILTHEDSRLTCVDPFVIVGTRERFLHNIKALGCEDKISARALISDQVSLDMESWDFVYIDGLHKARSALIDACRSWVTLKQGGIMIWDDYQWQMNAYPRVECPKMGIDAFLNCLEKELDILHIGAQVIVRKR